VEDSLAESQRFLLALFSTSHFDGGGMPAAFSIRGRYEHYVPWRPFVFSVLNSRIKVEAAPNIVHLPLVFLNEHVIEGRLAPTVDWAAEKHLVETTAA